MQQADGFAAPVIERLRQPLNQRIGTKNPAVEQQRVGQNRAVLAQKFGNMPGNGGIARIRQAKRHDAAARLQRLRISVHLREKTVHDELFNVLARQRDRAAAADHFGAAAEQRHGRLFRRISGQQLLFGDAAAIHQLRQPAGRQGR